MKPGRILPMGRPEHDPLISQGRLTIVLLVAFLVLSAIYVMMPALNLGFVSDDFVHLSNDSGMPWYYSSDTLYRPLRNGLFKIMAHSFGLEPLPYRLFALLAYLLCGFLWYRLLRALDIAAGAAMGAVALAFFTPRIHALLFWFAAVQDVLYVVCALGVILCWIRFRQRGRRGALIGSFSLYALALGLKETAIITPALVALADWFIVWPQGMAKTRIRNWVPYAGFLLPLVLFGAFIYWYPPGRLSMPAAEAARSTYGGAGFVGTASAELRSGLNLLVPFENPFALRDIDASLGIEIAVVLIAVAGLAVFSVKKIWLFAAVWMMVALLPTSMFARTKNIDYYVFFAGFGVAAAISSSLYDLAKSLPRPVKGALVATFLCYCVAGDWRLAKHREQWRIAVASAERVVTAAKAVLPQAGPRQVDFINVPHSIGDKPILNNGLHGALIAAGYDPNLTLNVNPEAPVPDGQQNQLIAAVRACSMAEPQNDHRVLLIENFVVTDHTSGCARSAVAQDLRLRPWEWFPDPGSQR